MPFYNDNNLFKKEEVIIMSISSLGRSIASPNLREPVAQVSLSEINAKIKKSGAKVTELPDRKTVQEIDKAQVSANEKINASQGDIQNTLQVVDEVQRFQDLMRRNDIKFDASGPLSRPEFTIVDRVNNIDFEREIPPEALKKRIFELREDFISDLSADNISIDVSDSLSNMVVIIKESINETEFIRHLPSEITDQRVKNLMAFAQDQGFDFEAVA
jgi:hypothetical protein